MCLSQEILVGVVLSLPVIPPSDIDQNPTVVSSTTQLNESQLKFTKWYPCGMLLQLPPKSLLFLPFFTLLMYKRESKNTIKQALCMLPYVPDTIKSLAIWFNTQPKPEYWRLKKQHTTVHSTFHINVTL